MAAGKRGPMVAITRPAENCQYRHKLPRSPKLVICFFRMVRGMSKICMLKGVAGVLVLR